ncbi:MAG: hypothetical protein GWN73_16545, partial [Actinobacteria bacterium]|nr:hypothetical protein [Actinomycetota bacterium]NIS31845.1 hypothetical protein [Actinomycetota bacterium]NIU66938.1 hypothetical protein [Actinomycetota bacterium]NIW28734.1 hypothetical protein [Actinomycetota bacterium]
MSHSGGFPVVESPSPDARWNPYRSTVDGVACGLASVEAAPPPCPAEDYVTYDLHIVHSVDLSNPTLLSDYPDHPLGEGTPTYFERMRVVVRDPETIAATVVDVIRDATPYPMIADPSGFGFVYDAADDATRNPYLHRSPGDPTGPTYIGGVASIEPAATNDGRMVIWNGGDEHPYGVNLTYSYNPNPVAMTGWSPPKNVAYMYWVEGPGAPGGETTIPIDGELVPFSEVFPIARQPLRDQSGDLYEPGTSYVPATRNDPSVEYP